MIAAIYPIRIQVFGYQRNHFQYGLDLSGPRAHQYSVLYALKQYIYTKAPQYIEDPDHFKFQMGPMTNVNIINHIIEHVR